MLFRLWFSVLILFATAAHARADITIFTNLTDWQDATELVVTEPDVRISGNQVGMWNHDDVHRSPGGNRKCAVHRRLAVPVSWEK